MSRRRSRTKGRSDGAGSYVAFPHAVLNSPNFLTLSAHAAKLLLDMASSYKGSNNGDLCGAWGVMKSRGWKSRDTLTKALKELVSSGMIELTRQGGIHKASLYALTWKPIDECNGKLDVNPTTVPSGLWRSEPMRARSSAYGKKLRWPTRPACLVDTAGVSIVHEPPRIDTVGVSISAESPSA